MADSFFNQTTKLLVCNFTKSGASHQFFCRNSENISSEKKYITSEKGIEDALASCQERKDAVVSSHAIFVKRKIILR